MLDQTLLSILLSALAILGTLGGAFGSTILANRRAKELEELRIAQDKLKRNIAVIEEVYMLLTSIDTHLTEDLHNDHVSLRSKQADLNRVETLIYLYLPFLREKFDELRGAMHEIIMEANLQLMDSEPGDLLVLAPDEVDVYREKLMVLRMELEKLVK